MTTCHWPSNDRFLFFFSRSQQYFSPLYFYDLEKALGPRTQRKKGRWPVRLPLGFKMPVFLSFLFSLSFSLLLTPLSSSSTPFARLTISNLLFNLRSQSNVHLILLYFPRNEPLLHQKKSFWNRKDSHYFVPKRILWTWLSSLSFLILSSELFDLQLLSTTLFPFKIFSSWDSLSADPNGIAPWLYTSPFSFYHPSDEPIFVLYGGEIFIRNKKESR